MSRSAFQHAALLFAIVLVVGSVCAQSPVDSSRAPQHEHKRAEREEIEQLEQQFQKAELAGDIPTLDKLLSDDYLGVNANGELSTKAQQLDHIRNRTLVLTRLDASDVKIKLIGPTAIVNSEVQVEGSLDGVSLKGRFRYTRIYQRSPTGVWKVTSFEATRIRHPERAASTNPKN
jgi:ketosteroid isomerase-like protein